MWVFFYDLKSYKIEIVSQLFKGRWMWSEHCGTEEKLNIQQLRIPWHHGKESESWDFFMFSFPLSLFGRNEESCAPWTAALSGIKALHCWGLLRLWRAGPDIDIFIVFPRSGLVLVSPRGGANPAVPPQGGEGTQRGQGLSARLDGFNPEDGASRELQSIPNQHTKELLLAQMSCSPALAKDLKLFLLKEHSPSLTTQLFLSLLGF